MRIIIATAVLTLMMVLTSACGEEVSQEESEMRSTLDSFTAALNAGNYEEAYGMFSNWCRKGLPLENFTEEWGSILSPDEGGAGQLELTDLDVVSREDSPHMEGSLYRVKTTFQMVRDGTTTSFGSESDPLVEWMVKEDGEWHIHDKVCEFLSPPPEGSPTPEE